MKILVLFLFLSATIFMFLNKAQTAAHPAFSSISRQCSDGWKITGYFTPVEADYATDETTEITVPGLTDKLVFSSKFIRAIIIEGWGKTNAGWYLGYDHETQKWQKSSAPLDNNGDALTVGMIAADKSVLQMNSKVSIPSLPSDWGKMIYTATDIGLTELGEVSVKNKHIDVYTGEGKEAERQTFVITRESPDELVEVCAVD
ncbi:MAG: hypothetical protein ABI954_15485 [Pyrinomonadaceae bacterium]